MADTDTYSEQSKAEIKISVRHLVEFLLRDGDIDNRRQGGGETAMQEGSRIHRMIQKRMGAEYQAEVFLRYRQETKYYTLVVEGRADGVIERPEEVLIDEIKGTYRDLNKLHRPVPVHMAQAKCYACIYAAQKGYERVRIRLTYCHMDTEDIRYFYEEYTRKELEEWFEKLLADYRKWADFSWEWKQKRQKSLEDLVFPFAYRDGQRELVSYVYQTIYHKRKLFLEAPTGVGKTISTVFPALKSMSKNRGDKLFYLTAKTITGTVADETFALLRERGLAFKSVALTAKEKICFQEKAECNPLACPYAKGHYDRINEAVYDLLVHEDNFSRQQITLYAMRHQVCPFEMALDMSLFSDGIICDYNYLFDPHVYLKRFFAEGTTGDYLFLIDEAHNLLERGREMYSASLIKEDFLLLKTHIKQAIQEETKESIDGQMSLALLQEQDGAIAPGDLEEGALLFAKENGEAKKKRRRKGGKSILVREGYAEKIVHHLDRCNRVLLQYKRQCEQYLLLEKLDELMNGLLRLYNVMADYLEEQEETLPVKEELLDFYFSLAHFLDIYERLDEHYVRYAQLREDGSFEVKLLCVNPGENLKQCMQKGRSAILFSATFLPIQYYKKLLGGEKSDYEVYAKSVFSPEKQGLFLANDVTSRYTHRTQEQYERIAAYIHRVVRSRDGNYMVFFPSYSFLRQIYEIYMQKYAGEEQECLVQQEAMDEEAREAFLNRFRGNEACDLTAQIHMEIEIEEEPRSLVAFCVLGGIFGEGIDLKKDSLIGVIVVGTGLPQVCYEREILKNYFDDRGENGFDYAYRYPGMNKVLQAAGRVIRTAEDVGIVALLDDRFLQFSYRKLFPREWESFWEVTEETVELRLERFWDSWSKYESLESYQK